MSRTILKNSLQTPLYLVVLRECFVSYGWLQGSLYDRKLHFFAHFFGWELLEYILVNQVEYLFIIVYFDFSTQEDTHITFCSNLT